MAELNKNMVEVKGTMIQVKGIVERFDERLQEMAQESLMRIKDLQAPNYPYPHLVEVKETQANGKRGVFRSIFVKDMALHFLCPADMSTVPCGVGGNGYRLRKKHDWVKRFSPALQVRRAFCGAGRIMTRQLPVGPLR